MSQARSWCFTLNNWTEAEFNILKAVLCVYLVIGKETGENGTPHLQGYISFDSRKRLGAVKVFAPRAHWEVARGSPKQASDYCKKDGDFFEFGELPDCGKRGREAEQLRWTEAKRACIEGRIDDVPDDIFFRYYRTCKEIRKDYMDVPTDADETTGVWIYGPPGVGKSHKARADYPNSYLKMQNKWWDGYQGQETVILDDFDSKELGHLLKIWCDRYAFLAETKGGAMSIRPKKIIITSNYSIDEIAWDSVTREAVKRRMQVIHMTSREPEVITFM